MQQNKYQQLKFPISKVGIHDVIHQETSYPIATENFEQSLHIGFALERQAGGRRHQPNKEVLLSLRWG